MKEIWDLSKQIDFNNLIYYFTSKTVPKIPKIKVYKNFIKK